MSHKLEVGKTYNLIGGGTIRIIHRLSNPVMPNLPLVGIVSNDPGYEHEFILYYPEDGFLLSDPNYALNVRFGPKITQAVRRVYKDGLIGNSAPSLSELPPLTDSQRAMLHSILIFTYHDDVLYNVGFARAQ